MFQKVILLYSALYFMLLINFPQAILLLQALKQRAFSITGVGLSRDRLDGVTKGNGSLDCKMCLLL